MKKLALVLLSTLCLHCTAPLEPPSFASIANQLPNPCQEVGLSPYETLGDLIEAGKTCRQAHILSEMIAFDIERGETADRVLAVARAEALALASLNVFDTTDSPRLGQISAPVEVVIFSDFQCPYCRLSAGVMHDLLTARPETVTIVFKHMPLNRHPLAYPAALVSAYAQTKGQFWPVHDMLFEEQKGLSRTRIIEILVSLGGSENEVLDEKGNHALASVIEADLAEAKLANVQGTPTVFVNGAEVSGATIFARMQHRIDAEITAQALSFDP
ncbi:MAG: DsbA family protein [Proteobacteria bacterium]|nr:DsbA family protein [Pseudomonadota bacterium]